MGPRNQIEFSKVQKYFTKRALEIKLDLGGSRK